MVSRKINFKAFVITSDETTKSKIRVKNRSFEVLSIKCLDKNEIKKYAYILCANKTNTNIIENNLKTFGVTEQNLYKVCEWGINN